MNNDMKPSAQSAMIRSSPSEVRVVAEPSSSSGTAICAGSVVFRTPGAVFRMPGCGGTVVFRMGTIGTLLFRMLGPLGPLGWSSSGSSSSSSSSDCSCSSSCCS